MHALEATARRLAGQRRFAAALDAGLDAVRMEPLRESAHHTVIAVHLAEGNVVEAVKQYERFRALLHTELQIEPSDPLTELVSSRLPTGGLATSARTS